MALPNTQSIINRDNDRITGVQKNCTSQPSILVAGVAYTPTQIVQIYQADLDARAAVKTARVALKALLLKSSTAESAAATFDGAFKLCIEGAYAHQPDTLADFGITIPVRKELPVATKAVAVSKAKATRESKQPVATVAPSAASTVPATTAPAIAASSGAGTPHP
jgi:hypothetical protein